MTDSLVIDIDPAGTLRCLYTDAIPLASIGRLTVTRASTVEYDEQRQLWTVALPNGQLIFANPSRQACLDFERRYFNSQLQSQVDGPLVN